MFTDNPYEKFHFGEWWDTLSPTFISFYFIAFVFLLVLLYYLLPRKARWCVLLAGSVGFYCLAGLHPLITVLLSAFIVYCAGLLLEMTDKAHKKKRRFILLSASAILLAVLAYGKIYTLFDLHFGYIIPLGISYYTFSAVGYLADVYWGKEKAEWNYFKLALFLLFFPKILQGPISKHRELAKQLNEGHAFDWQNFCFGMQLAVWGYFKKMVIADRIALFTGTVFADYNKFGGIMLLIAFSLSVVQLYCDFSGCMDIAGGISQMFGIQLEKNFNHPFFSKSAAEFWRRWHITLGTWFKDYVYMPITINPTLIKLSSKIGKKWNRRAGRIFLTVIPLSAVWILTGVWHGTGLSYVIWGVYWGVLIILSTVLAPEIKKLNNRLHIDVTKKGWQVFQMVRTFLLFCIGRVVTVPGDLAMTGRILKKMVTDLRPWQLTDGTLYAQGLDWKEFVLMLMMIGVLWFVSMQQEKGSVREKIAGWNIVIRCAFYAWSVIFILIFGIYGIGYDTSSFVYMQY